MHSRYQPGDARAGAIRPRPAKLRSAGPIGPGSRYLGSVDAPQSLPLHTNVNLSEHSPLRSTIESPTSPAL